MNVFSTAAISAKDNLALSVSPAFLHGPVHFQISFHVGAAIFEFATLNQKGLPKVFHAIESILARDVVDPVALASQMRSFVTSNVYLGLFAQAFLHARCQAEWSEAFHCLTQVLPNIPAFHSLPTEPDDAIAMVGALVVESLCKVQSRLLSDLNLLYGENRPFPEHTALQRYYLLRDKLHLGIPADGFRLSLAPSTPITAGADEANMLLQDKLSLCTTYLLENISELLRLDLFLAVSQDLPVKRCKNCGGLFIPRGRSDTEYCARIYRNGKKCSEIGASLHFSRTHKTDPIQQAYLTAYRRADSRRRQSTSPTLSEFKRWGDEARRMRQSCAAGEITLVAFQSWLDENKRRDYEWPQA